MLFTGVVSSVRKFESKSGKDYWRVEVAGNNLVTFFAPKFQEGQSINGEADDRGILKKAEIIEKQIAVTSSEPTRTVSNNAAYAEGARSGNAKTSGISLAVAFFQTTKPKWDFGELCEHALLASKYVYEWDLTAPTSAPADFKEASEV